MSHFQRIRHVESTGSTNDDIGRILGSDDAAGLTLVASFQTRGAGRKGRCWVAPAGSSLLFTTALPDPIAPQLLATVPFWTALAVRSALLRFGVDAELQWPNDVLLHRRKLCGIMCISRVIGDVAFAACGVGMNVRRFVGAEEIQPPSAFTEECGLTDAGALLRAILAEFNASLALLAAPATVTALWERAAGLPDKRYRIVPDEGRSFEARVVRLETDGRLVVDDGVCERTISMADVRVAREDA